MKKIAIFDIDGTVFRSSLLVELTDALIQEGIFSVGARDNYIKAYQRWLDRKGTYGEYLQILILTFENYMKGVRHEDFIRIGSRVASFHKNRVYRYTRDLIFRLRQKNYYLLAISHSPEEIVKEFCRHLKFNKVYGWQMKFRDGKFVGIMDDNFNYDKAFILKQAVLENDLTLRGSIGVGDTEGDIPFLKMVERPICFNPNQKLYRYAKRVGWPIVVERKDVIYRF